MNRSAIPYSVFAVLIVSLMMLTVFLSTTLYSGGLRVNAQHTGDDKLFNEVQKLEDEQKYKAAVEKLDAIIANAEKKDNDSLLTRSLIRRTRLQIGLHGYETAVRSMMESTWPETEPYVSLMHLFYAHTLFTYYNAYGWEINKREKVVSKKEVDLKKWTARQIFETANASYLTAWKEREQLGAIDIHDFPDFIVAGNYPKGMKDTVRDFISYDYVQFLNNTTTWTAEESQNKYLLDFKWLVDKPEKRHWKDRNPLSEQGAHPLLKLVFILDDVFRWARERGNQAAALEARLTRLRMLAGHFTRAQQLDAVISHLEEMLPEYRDVDWWACGMYELAALYSKKGDKVKARNIAIRGRDAYPRSIGAGRCEHLVKTIEAPSFTVETMTTDRPAERSIRITHKNMDRLYFRAYKLDFFKWMKRKGNSPSYSNWKELQRIVDQWSPDVEWSVPLVDLKDYESHHTFTSIPTNEPGFYLVAASAKQGFQPSNNRIDGVTTLLSPYVTVINARAHSWEVWVFDSASGKGVADAKVRVYHHDYNHGSALIHQVRTDAEGRVVIKKGKERAWNNIYIVVLKDGHLSFDRQFLYPYYQYRRNLTSGVFVYTDRSIYRPLQTVHYKIVAFSGKPQVGQFSVVTNHQISIQFRDPNGQQIATQTVKTNDFGTASGSFDIPKGRILGNYTIQALYGDQSGIAAIKVEEYKRPTFEVSIEKPKQQYVLNKEVTVKGNAKYYFGLPVAEGKVSWKITRQPVFPWWYWWFYGYLSLNRSALTVSTGETALTPEGAFSFTFTPTGDPDLPDRETVSYHYVIEATVTDEGGETRKKTTSYRIGYVGIDSTISMDDVFVREQRSFSLSINRHNLDGVGQQGEGAYKVYRLIAPKKARAPYELPLPSPKNRKTIAGDLKRPRWEAEPGLTQRLFTWKEGESVRSDTISHDTHGNAGVTVKGLSVGAYRVVYTTKDRYGSEHRNTYNFLVVKDSMKLNIPLFLLLEKSSVDVGEEATLFVGSGLIDQPFYLEFYQSGTLLERRTLHSNKGAYLISYPIKESHRGGFSVRLFAQRDATFYDLSTTVSVPWSNKQLRLTFNTFRNKLHPGEKETWTVTVKGPENQHVTAELLAYMYDRSLDFFVPHRYPSPGSLYISKFGTSRWWSNLGQLGASSIFNHNWYSVPGMPSLYDSYFINVSGYGIGGLGRRNYYAMAEEKTLLARAPAPARKRAAKMKASDEAPREMKEGEIDSLGSTSEMKSNADKADGGEPPATEEVQLRSDFSETAFFQPHLLTRKDGSVDITFTVPDSVTSWKCYLHAITKDLKFVTAQKETVTVKELMVRPYMPRFLREGDVANLKVVVNNAAEKVLKGKVTLQIIDPVTEEDLSSQFDVKERSHSFKAEPQAGDTVTFQLRAPSHIGRYAVKVVARADDMSDGELRPFPVLPSRMHLIQSRFATLKKGQTRVLELPDMAKAGEDTSLINEQFVVTLDAQLIYGVLKALPYLVNYPYECVEQTLNRFLSTGIVTSLFDRYPPIKKMAQKFSSRKTQYEPWHKDDPNRTMTLEELPWLGVAQGGSMDSSKLLNIFDERIAHAQKQDALEKLRKAQLNSGAFPWWPGGPPSPYMTLYIMYGFAKAQEFGVDVPKDMIQKGWRYLHSYFTDYYAKRMLIEDFGYEFITYLNYVLSCYPDHSYYEGSFSAEERRIMLNYSFKYWRDHNPYMKAYLTLTLFREGRKDDAELVLDSIMDSAVTKEDQGTFWAPEDRGWLWYNDRIESHAFILRVLQEVRPNDTHIDGLILWLMLNKKFNQWKSTRTTAEVIYSLVSTLKHQGALAVREKAVVNLGNERHEYVFEPDEYTGDNTQIVIPGSKVIPDKMWQTSVTKEGEGYLFASVTWHYSTEKLPETARGDYLQVKRSYFIRTHRGKETVLLPLAEGTPIKIGDQIEVHLSIRAKHPMEYIHLRDPRGAGFEPEKFTSGYHWDLGIVWYEEIRDNGTNFFFENLPQGEYTFKYRLRASMAGTFRVGPATLQSMYAPEFAAFSSGKVIQIKD